LAAVLKRSQRNQRVRVAWQDFEEVTLTHPGQKLQTPLIQ
jgi:hypothetical protein